jgi:pimeloyl-ACP methyl ester carboxylesterase
MSPEPSVVQRGSGPPLVLVPGVQGRWEWMRPAVAALAAHFRVVTFSLAGEKTSGVALEAEGGFDCHVRQLDHALADAGVERAVLCGVSFGGLVAARYAAERPGRVERLILVSTPAPSWRPEDRLRRDERSPRTSTVRFVTGAPGRLWAEISAALPARRDRWRAAAGYLWSVAASPASPARMLARVRCLVGHDFAADAARIAAPTLVITGEAGLDRVVPVDGTREWAAAIRGARAVTLERTGHIGLITRPSAFADLVWNFTRDVR